MLGNIGGTELLIICALILLFFGAKRLPDLAKNLGKGIGQFRTEVRNISDEVRGPVDDLTSHLK
jgi:sec-independent protein translocase protein TatA